MTDSQEPTKAPESKTISLPPIHLIFDGGDLLFLEIATRLEEEWYKQHDIPFAEHFKVPLNWGDQMNIDMHVMRNVVCAAAECACHVPANIGEVDAGLYVAAVSAICRARCDLKDLLEQAIILIGGNVTQPIVIYGECGDFLRRCLAFLSQVKGLTIILEQDELKSIDEPAWIPVTNEKPELDRPIVGLWLEEKHVDTCIRTSEGWAIYSDKSKVRSSLRLIPPNYYIILPEPPSAH